MSYVSRFLGMFLTALGGLAAIAVSLIVTGNPGSLWAILGVAAMMYQLPAGKKAEGFLPLAVGSSMFVLSIAISVGVYVTGNAGCLWGLLGVALVGYVITSSN